MTMLPDNYPFIHDVFIQDMMNAADEDFRKSTGHELTAEQKGILLKTIIRAIEHGKVEVISKPNINQW